MNGISSKGGYYKNGVFVPNAVSETDPLYILYGYPVNATFVTIEAGTKSNTTYEDDGHGVITSRVTYYGSQPKEIANGASHPSIGSLKCYRSSVSQDGKVYTTTAEYIGLASGKTTSSVVLSGDFGVSSAPIQVNKNFKTLKTNTAAAWNATTKQFDGDATDSLNLAGVKSYYAPTLTISGFFFTSNPSTLSTMITQVGTIMSSLNIPSEDASFYNQLKGGQGNKSNKFFVSGVSHERIAHLYKIKFSVIWSGDGWNSLIYS